VSRHDGDRLADIEQAVTAIHEHLRRGSLSDGLVFDAVRVRLIEIGEAANGLSAVARAAAPDVPWADVIGMRHALAHRYFDTSHAIVQATVDEDLDELLSAVERIRGQATAS
jgi:uncharacterized protein with HEPN domain